MRSVSCVGICGNTVIIDPTADVKPQRLFNCRPDSNSMLEPFLSMSKTAELLNTSLKQRFLSLHNVFTQIYCGVTPGDKQASSLV